MLPPNPNMFRVDDLLISCVEDACHALGIVGQAQVISMCMVRREVPLRIVLGMCGVWLRLALLLEVRRSEVYHSQFSSCLQKMRTDGFFSFVEKFVRFGHGFLRRSK